MLMSYSSKIFTIISFLATIPVLGFFILKDYHKFKKIFFASVPNKYFELTIILIQKIDSVVGTYFRAVLTEIVFVAILTTIVLATLGIKYSLAIGIIAGFANAIPYLGPMIGWFLAILSVVLTGMPIMMTVYVSIAMYAVQVIDNNIVYPVVIGKNTEMHPLVILLTVIAGGYTLGVMGMFLSVPLVFLVKETITVLYKNLKDFEII